MWRTRRWCWSTTARAAYDRAYELVFAEDAMSGVSAEAHHFACRNTFRNMGRVRSTVHILDALRAGTGEASGSRR